MCRHSPIPQPNIGLNCELSAGRWPCITKYGWPSLHSMRANGPAFKTGGVLSVATSRKRESVMANWYRVGLGLGTPPLTARVNYRELIQ